MISLRPCSSPSGLSDVLDVDIFVDCHVSLVVVGFLIEMLEEQEEGEQRHLLRY
jgi:hypothetical protein